MGNVNWTLDDIQKKINKGTLPQQNIDLFSSGLPASVIPGITRPELPVSNEQMRELELIIPLLTDPIPKQSTRMAVARHQKDGWSPGGIEHKRGDVIIYRNKQTKHLDVIIQPYRDPKITKYEKYLKETIRGLLPLGFKIFENKVYVTKLHFVFTILESFPQYKKKAIMEGKIIDKTTQPDLTDNLSKALYDSMHEIIFLNDGIVCREDGKMKYYGTKPMILINMKGY